MPHIHTGTGEYDHTASAYIFRLDGDEPRVMLHMHKRFKCYMQFGGHIELNEDPWSALLHELKEETGYQPHQLRVLQPKQRIKKLSDANLHPVPVVLASHPVNETHFHTDHGYALITHEKPAGKPGDGESLDIKLFTRDEIVALKTYENIREVILHVFDVCLKEWERVKL